MKPGPAPPSQVLEDVDAHGARERWRTVEELVLSASAGSSWKRSSVKQSAMTINARVALGPAHESQRRARASARVLDDARGEQTVALRPLDHRERHSMLHGARRY
jgi:hypothetical protein